MPAWSSTRRARGPSSGPCRATSPRTRTDGPSGVPWLGDDAALAARLGDLGTGDRPWLVLGFGGGEASGGLATRTATTARFGPDTRWATVVHATASVSPSATLDDGAVVLAGAVVNTGARVGRHAIVNSAAVVEHDVVIGPGSHVAPGAVVGGGTTHRGAHLRRSRRAHPRPHRDRCRGRRRDGRRRRRIDRAWRHRRRRPGAPASSQAP